MSNSLFFNLFLRLLSVMLLTAGCVAVEAALYAFAGVSALTSVAAVIIGTISVQPMGRDVVQLVVVAVGRLALDWTLFQLRGRRHGGLVPPLPRSPPFLLVIHATCA